MLWRGSPSGFWCLALEALIEAFPFEIKGFHADNGSEYINYRVARLLRVGSRIKARIFGEQPS